MFHIGIRYKVGVYIVPYSTGGGEGSIPKYLGGVFKRRRGRKKEKGKGKGQKERKGKKIEKGKG